MISLRSAATFMKNMHGIYLAFIVKWFSPIIVRYLHEFFWTNLILGLFTCISTHKRVTSSSKLWIFRFGFNLVVNSQKSSRSCMRDGKSHSIHRKGLKLRCLWLVRSKVIVDILYWIWKQSSQMELSGYLHWNLFESLNNAFLLNEM